MCLTRNQVCRKVPGVRIPPSPPLFNFYQNLISQVKEEDSESELPVCVTDSCVYPETCRWNHRCMEEGMLESKKAKMVREETLGREDCDEMEK
jgi:hypothetical protein